MRHPFVLATLVLIASFGAPLLASACTVGDYCANSDGSVGTCVQNSDGSTGCSPVQTTGVNTSQTQTTGVNTGGSNVTLINPLGSGASLSSFLTSILQFVIRIGSIVVILMLVYVGYMFVIARGEPDKITEARQALLWTIVGALILLGAQAIAIGIQATVQALSVGS